jgi:CHAT domain-containing protein/Tfp pilus assembly protein PilF
MGRRSGTLFLYSLLVLSIGPIVAREGDSPDSPTRAAPPPVANAPAKPADAPDDPAVAQVRKLVDDGHYAEAETTAREFLETRRAAGETESKAVARVTQALVEALTKGTKAREPATRELALRSVDLARRLYGEESDDYAQSLFDLGELAFRNESLDEAGTAYAQTIAIQEKIHGPRSPQVAFTLSKAAAVEGVSGHFKSCREFLERAVSIQEETLGPDALQVAGVRHNLSIMMSQTGDILGAVEEDEKVLAIRAKRLPPDHPLTALTMQNLAFLKYRLGDFVAAKGLFEKALGMQERSLGPEHSEIGLTLGNLGATLAAMGRLPEARADYERALEIVEKSVTDNHSLLARCRSELAPLLAQMGEGARAKELMSAAISSLEAKFGPVNQVVAGALHDLAVIEAGLGEAAAARRHDEQALSIFDEVYGPDNPFSTRALIGLGELRLDAGELAEAEPYLRRALAIDESALGAQHPEGARVRVDLARLALARGDGDGALRTSLRAEEILRAHFDLLLLGLSEREALDYERVRLSGLGIALSVLASRGGRAQDPSSVEQVWSGLAGSRALVLDRISLRHRLLVSSVTPEARAMTRSLAAATNRLASLVVKGPDPGHPGDYSRALSEATEERERIERDVAQHNGAQPTDLAGAGSLAAIKEALPPGTALLGFVRFTRTAVAVPKAGPAAGRAPGRLSWTYAAFVLNGRRSAPRFMVLGSADAIEPLVSSWMKEAAQSGATPPGAAAETGYRDAGAAMRARVWDPVEKALSGARTIFIVADGAINLVNFAALPVGDHEYLIERGQVFHYLSAERDLLDHGARAAGKPGSLVVGAPDFDAAPDAIAQVAGMSSGAPEGAASTAAPPVAVFRGSTSACADFTTLRFDPLPAALQEASAVESIWRRAAGRDDAGTTRLTGPLASEAAFKAIAPQRGRLHLATHGFYLGATCGAPGAASTGLGEDPLLLSGLALAGANNRASAPRDAEDGILTAEEIASLDLSGVEWAVLSGCETAVGSIQAGEGIFGLRRAFEVAGADTLIMSLWKVEDRATLEWMKTLYERHAAGVPVPDAVRDADLAILRARRDKGWSTHPFYWGAFVSAGGWR